MVNAWRRRRCLCLGLFGNWRTLCQLSNLSSSCTGLTGTSFRRDTTGHCIAILHIRGRRLAPVLVQLPEDQEDTEPDRTWIAIEQVEVAPGETGFGRLRRASNFTLFDWAGPKRILGEQNHAPLCLVQVSFKQLVEGESCAGYWKKLSMNEITQVGTETFNN